MPDADVEQSLAGGLGNGGAVVRVGSTVRRPTGPASDATHAFLNHLAEVGFEGAPRFLGFDDKGREILDFIDGDVGIPPFAPWTTDGPLLVSVAELQHRLHRAAASFVTPSGASWPSTMTPSMVTGSLVCHNDLCIENVVVRQGRAVAFIDFDFAAPTDRLLDIAIAARHWIPLRHPDDLDVAWRDVDQVARFGSFADTHALDSSARAKVLMLGGQFLDHAMGTMKARADAGLPAYVAAWEGGYPDQNRRSRRWLDAHAAALTNAR